MGRDLIDMHHILKARRGAGGRDAAGLRAERDALSAELESVKAERDALSAELESARKALAAHAKRKGSAQT